MNKRKTVIFLIIGLVLIVSIGTIAGLNGAFSPREEGGELENVSGSTVVNGSNSSAGGKNQGTQSPPPEL